MNYKNKKGVSVLVGYVLLITFVIFMGVIIYSWMKSYVPKNDLNCPDGTSLFIKDYECDSSELNITLKNNGRFNVGGYFIRVTDTPQAGLATIDISQNLTSGGSTITPFGVKFQGNDNSLVPTYDETHIFDISDYAQIYSLEIVPLRWQEEDRRKRLVTCKTSILREDITCT